MEEEKEVAEEKEEEEDENEGERLHLITGTSTVDSQNLPIMHWDDLSQRIAELEQQEQERSERSKVSSADKRWAEARSLLIFLEKKKMKK